LYFLFFPFSAGEQADQDGTSGLNFRGNYFTGFFIYILYSTLLHLLPSDTIVSEAAGIEPRTVATFRIGRQML
jgi:hypothetical protein